MSGTLAPDHAASPVSFHDGRIRLHGGDCLEILKTLPDNHFDSVVTDPPYHLTSIVKRFGGPNAAECQEGSDGLFKRASAGFMGKQWDGGDIAFQPELWRAVFRVLKPGGHLAAFGGTRTYHNMAVAIERAGFEIRDMLQWLYGSGFPKSTDVADDIDRHLFRAWIDADAQRRSGYDADMRAARAIEERGARNLAVAGVRETWMRRGGFWGELLAEGAPVKRMIPGAEQARAGWEKNDGRDYQPGQWIYATQEAQRWEGFGTALKPACEPICLGRKPISEKTIAANVLAHGTGALNIDGCRVATEETIKATRNVAMGSSGSGIFGGADVPGVYQQRDAGRWPANILHDGSEEVVGTFPESESGGGPAVGVARSKVNTFGDPSINLAQPYGANSGSAARFFYSAKADADDRIGSKHPTVKPVDLMRWLVRLVTPPGGRVLDCFAGTGTTGEACLRENFNCELIERESEYRADIARRMALALAGRDERARESLKARGKVETVEALPLFGGGG